MSVMERPEVKVLPCNGKVWEQEYKDFYLTEYVPDTDIDGSVNNYTFKAPLLIVLEEERRSIDEKVKFAEESGLAKIASRYDAGVLFVYPTAEGGWEAADETLYASLIAEVKMVPEYRDGIAEVNDFFKKEFQGYFIRGAKFRADVYGFGKSADYIAKNLLKKIDGEFLWGPGEITPAVCSMERLSVKPNLERKDIAVLSVANSSEINEAFKECENLLVKEKAEYEKDFDGFVKKYKMWIGKIQFEPDFDELGMIEEANYITVQTSSDNQGIYKNDKEHKVGYFAYYNKGLFDKGPAPLVVGFHGGGDSALYFTFITEWFDIARKNNFILVVLENHQFVTATETAEFIGELRKRYSVDEKRIYATGFSMGSCKTWEMIQEYPEIFAGFAPGSALPPVKNNYLAVSHGENFNEDISVPIFYSGGEKSHLPELPFQHETALERIKYLAQINKFNVKFDKEFEEKDKFEDPIWTVKGDRVEVKHDDEKDADLTVHYFISSDGVCRTALASVNNQVHEFRRHSCENAWEFISGFTKN